LINPTYLSKHHPQQGSRLLNPILKGFLLLSICFINSSILYGQQTSGISSLTVEEEQDFAFAMGLYQDSLFQLAGRQFESFSSKYPNSAKRQESDFLRCECLFQSSQFQKAEGGYAGFIRDYPASGRLPEAYLRLGQSYLAEKKYAQAVAAIKNVTDNYAESKVAAEASYWMGEAFLKNGDTRNAIKYYNLSYEKYPDSRLRDYSLYSIAWSYQKSGEYAKAVESYERLITEFPGSTLTSGAYIRIGECYYYSKDYKRAVSALTKMRPNIKDNDELGNADYLIAEATYKLGDVAGAQKKYENFLTNYPGHKLVPEVTYVLGWIYLKLKNYAKAVETFNMIAGRSDELGRASLYQRSVAERNLKLPDKALQTLHEVLKHEPPGEWTDNALFDMGVISFEKKEYAESVAFFKRIADDFPDSDIRPETYRMLGECSYAGNDFETAMKWYEKAESDPSAPENIRIDASFQAAMCRFMIKQYREAAQKFSLFVKQYPGDPRTGEAKFFQAESEYHSGNFAEAVKAYSESAGSPHNAKREDALYGAAWSLYKQGKTQEAIEAFEKQLIGYPKGKFALDARLRIGDAYLSMKDYKGAIGSYRHAIRLFPDSSSVDYAYYQLGQSFLKSGNSTEAVKSFDQLIRIMPKSSLADDAQFAKGWVNFQRKQYREAIREFQTLVASYPASELSPRAYYSIGDSYYNMQKYPEAEKAYRELAKRFPNSSYVTDAVTGIQYCLEAQGKEEEAVKVIDDFIKGASKSAAVEELQLKKIELLFSRHKYTETVKTCREFIANNPRSGYQANVRLTLARCYRAQGKPDEAASVCEQIADIQGAPEKTIGEALFEAAEIYLMQNKPDKARHAAKMIEEKLKDRELLAGAIMITGHSMELTGDSKKAIDAFEEVIKKYSDLPVADVARVAEARIYFQLKEYGKARAVAGKTAVSRKDETGAEAQYIVGASLAGEKKFNEAITALLRVKYLFPAYEKWVGSAYLGLGDAYEQTKDMRRARESYQAVLKMKTEAQVIEEAKRRLKRME
jgi:TolA-binding protein